MLFVGPHRTGETDAVGHARHGEGVTYRVWCERRDIGGAEGFVTEGQAGGTWEREYRCWAEAFPAGVRPQPAGWTLQADDGVPMRIRSVEELNSDTFPVKLRLRCYGSAGPQPQGGQR